ncbi:hypothetical protein [Epibacterium ulvae]|uniref:hypothetical protein n=1 Tax=Epibacterium ulvae TaxID=1156985 RepID=UPI0024902C7F|nr:hypothetical protein [Epibacterium ulvae]
MPILTFFSWVSWLAAALLAYLAIRDESIFFITPALAACISAVLFTAAERVISLLTDIRDAMVPDIEEHDEEDETQSDEQLRANLERIRAGLPPVD